MSSDESAEYRRFWTQLLDAARVRTDLHARTKASNDWWIGSMRRGITYNYVLRKDSAYIELWIDQGNIETNEAIFQNLLAHRDEIERAYGRPLIWHRARGRGRAVQFVVAHCGFDDHERWPEIQEGLIVAMIRLEAACGPYLYGPLRLSVETSPPVAEKPYHSVLRPVSKWTGLVEGSGDIVTIANLRAGISEFRRRWPGELDFNDRLYQELRARRDAGQLTWEYVVDILSAWRALRTPWPGRDKRWYLARGEEPFRRMLVLVGHIRAAHAGHDPDITEAHPGELQGPFAMAVDIKGSSSPVFSSKLCHFLIPSAFPVADQDMLGIFSVDDYWQYWQRCAEGWRASGEKEALKAELRAAMSAAPFPAYPWATKIAELCHAGERNRRD